jgi:hypothetical protein
MDARTPTGILYVNTDVDAPHKRDEYHRWYLDIHFPEVTSPGIFAGAVMFRNARDSLPEDERAFLAMYETTWPDVGQAALAFERHVEGLFAANRIHPGTVGGRFAVLERRCRHFAPSGGGRSQSLVVLHLDAAPGADDALRRDAPAAIAPAVAQGGAFHTASLYERIETAAFARSTPSDQPRWLALFESDRGDPVALADRLERQLGESGLPGAVRRGSASCFYRSSSD